MSIPARSERVGLVCLVLALSACFAVEWWRAGLPDEPEPIGVVALLDALNRFPDPVRRVEHEEGSSGPIHVDELDSAGWVALGLSPAQASSALRYRAAIGGFQSEAALARMRVLPADWLGRHRKRLRFPEGERSDDQGVEPEPQGQSARPARPELRHSVSAGPVDLNRADSLELLRVKGVGPWVTGRILQSRRRWGGFAQVEQLRTALGWDSLADALAPRFTASAADVDRRCADSLDAAGWARLPGVRWKEAQVLERYVAHHGSSDSALARCLGVRPAILEGLGDYLRPCTHPPPIEGDLSGQIRTQ